MASESKKIRKGHWEPASRICIVGDIDQIEDVPGWGRVAWISVLVNPDGNGMRRYHWPLPLHAAEEIEGARSIQLTVTYCYGDDELDSHASEEK